MSNKISKILGIGLVAAVLASLFVAATPAFAGNLTWSGESTLPTRSGADVVDIATASNGTTVYAAGGATNLVFNTAGATYNLAKSTNGGTSWAATGLPSIGTGIPALASGVISVKAVAIAPDSADGSYVAVIVSENTTGTARDAIYASSNGGATFDGPSTPATGAVLNDLSISTTVNGVRSLALAGTDGAGNAKLWILVPGGGTFGGGGWVDVTVASATSNVTYMAVNQATALAVAFSPNYLGDRVVVVVTANTTGVKVQLYNAAVGIWNSPVYAGWAGVVGNGGVALTAVNALPTSAALALSPTYLANDPASRLVYVAVNGTTAAPGTVGLFRLADVGPAFTLSSAQMNSVAVNAAGDKLVAGAAATNTVYRLAAPATALVGASASSTYKSPALATDTNTVVAFAGTNVVAGTTGAESAFSVSTDDGKDFSDVSLVDSTATLMDFTVSADGSKIYLVASSGTAVSVWKKTTAYTRILCQADAVGDYLVDIAPENSDVVYVAQKGGSQIWYGNDGGATSWTLSLWTSTIADFHVEAAATVWVASASGSVAKSTNAGIFFNPVTTLNFSINTINVIGANSVLVGGTAGQVAYTADGATFTTLTGVGTGGVQVTADKLTTGGNIYAAGTATTGGIISRYTIGTSVAFTQIQPSTAASTNPVTAGGIALGGTTLYVTFDDTSATRVFRTLTPTTASAFGGWNTPVVNITNAPQDSITLAAQRFLDGPRGLVATVGSDKNPKLWAIGTSVTGVSLESMVDTLTAAGPTLSAPANASTIQINVQTGQATDVVYTWSAVAGATKYTFQIALDSAFTQVLATQSPTGTTMLFGPNVAGPDGTTKIVYQPDTTYYWRVKVAVDGPMDTPNSATGNFKIGSLAPLQLVNPASGASDVPVKPDFSWRPVTGATNYEIFVSDDPTFAVITFSANSDKPVYSATEALAYSTTYYWRVRASAPATAVTPFVYGIFTTEARPTTPTPPITITQTNTTITQTVPPPVNVIPNYLLWIIIGIGAVLVIALIVLIIRGRRTG